MASEFALVRLTVDGDRIVARRRARARAAARRPHAARGRGRAGETLAADALANALAQVFVAEPGPGRVAVAMSGGVDSAVALLRYAPNAIGVTLRLWLDPAGPTPSVPAARPTP